MIEITEKLKDSENIEAMDPLNKVLQESLLYIAHGKKRYFDPTLGMVTHKISIVTILVINFNQKFHLIYFSGKKFNGLRC